MLFNVYLIHKPKKIKRNECVYGFCATSILWHTNSDLVKHPRIKSLCNLSRDCSTFSRYVHTEISQREASDIGDCGEIGTRHFAVLCVSIALVFVPKGSPLWQDSMHLKLLWNPRLNYKLFIPSSVPGEKPSSQGSKDLVTDWSVNLADRSRQGHVSNTVIL